MLRESVERFVSDHRGSAYRRLLASNSGWPSRNNWRRLADLGWLGLPFAEEEGGFGGGPVEVGILMEEFGRGLVAEPYVATVLLAGALVEICGNAAQKRKILPEIVRGDLMMSFAHSESDPRNGLQRINARAHRDADGWRLSGRKVAVLDAGTADMYVVSARCPQESTFPGTALFLVEQRAAGVSLRDAARIGGGRIGELTFDNVRLPAEARLGDVDAQPAIEMVIDRSIAAVSAEAVGLMRAMLESAIEFTKQRKQFGRSLASNQVIRHRLVDMYIACEEARSVALRAALLMGPASRNVSARTIAASGTKFKIGRCARNVAEAAVQLHGAMGVTEELDIGLYFKKVLAFEAMFGSTDYHMRRHSELILRSNTTEEVPWS